MKLGVVTPVLTLLPGAHARWEEEADLDDVVTVAREAERLGYHHLTCSEHVAVPEHVAPARGARYWDPLATFGYLAATTTAIRLATHVLVLGYHHPLEIAKRYGTLDRVCGGRLVLGVGVGSLREEFDVLGAPFDDRGARADDALRALRRCLGEARPAYAGTHYRFAGFIVDPHAPRRDVPLWVGGRTARSLRRAVELADGWAPFGLSPDAVARMIEEARGTEAWARRGQPPEIVLQGNRPFDPLGEPARTAEQVTRLRAAGATGLNVRVVHHSRAHYLEQLAAMRACVEGA